MINNYNNHCRLKAFFYSAGGVGCLVLCYLFFRYGASWVSSILGYALSLFMAHLFALGGTILIFWSAHYTWTRGGGLNEYGDSSLYPNLGDDTAGAIVVGHYAGRVTGPAYVLSQIFLAGPLWLLVARQLLQKRLPESAELEKRLEMALDRLRKADKWQTTLDQPDISMEIHCLARMDLIDFSVRQNVTRFKVRPADGI